MSRCILETIILIRQGCLLALAIVCVYTDLARGKLYNWVTVGGLAVGLAGAYLLDANLPGFPHLINAALAAAVGAGILLVVYLMGSLGAGDVKMMAAVGALAPFAGRAGVSSIGFVIVALMYAALVGAAIAVCVLIWQRRLAQGLKSSLRALFTLRAKPADGAPVTTIPYGVAIGTGVVWAWMELLVK